MYTEEYYIVCDAVAYNSKLDAEIGGCRFCINWMFDIGACRFDDLSEEQAGEPYPFSTADWNGDT